MKRVVILQADNWEACYVDGKCIEQHHSLGEGDGLLAFLQENAKEYNFTLDDIEEVWWNEEEDGNNILEEIGCFPENLSELNISDEHTKNI